MEPLSDSHSKELFTSAVFGSGQEYSRQLDGVSDEIVRRCAGLPQAIISTSSVLASQRDSITVQNMEQIQNILPANATSDEILKQVLMFCYNCLPSCLQTCLLYLSTYPENYIILKEDIVKQWVAGGFIFAETENGATKVAESYFDKLVNMGMIQQIDLNYSDEVLYYAVHHTVHDFITSKSKEENFVTVIDYSRRTLQFSNMVSHLSLQFGSARYATTPPSIGLSQVRSLAYTGLSSCLPTDTISEFKLLRILILHIWDDQPSTGVDLRGISELLLLRYLHVRCNGTVHLPDQIRGLKHLQTLEINARLAAIPSDIDHLRKLLHVRLGERTKLPDIVEKEYALADKQHAIQEKDVKSEKSEILNQVSAEDKKQITGSDSQFIQRRSNSKEVANVVQHFSKNQELGSAAQEKVNMRSCDSNVMAVDPSLELRFVFEPWKETSCCLRLHNKTDGFIAFEVKINKEKYHVRPSNGTMPPCSVRYITVTMKVWAVVPANIPCHDMLVVQSTGISESEDGEINYEELFKKAMAQNAVDVVKLPIAYVELSDYL